MWRLRFDDFSRATRSHTLAQATAQTRQILDAVRELLETATPMIEGTGLTLVGISVGNLHDDAAVQLALPFDRVAAAPTVSTPPWTTYAIGSGSTSSPAVLLGRPPSVGASSPIEHPSPLICWTGAHDERRAPRRHVRADPRGRPRAVRGLTPDQLALRIDADANSIAWLVWH